MYARVTMEEGPTNALDEGVEVLLRDLPELQGQPGFRGVYLLLNRTSGKTIAISLWETEAAMKASEDAYYGVRNEAVKASDAARATTELYEVAVHR